MGRPIRAIIDLSALQHNLGIIRSYAEDAKVMAVIKANAYGHGLIDVASALSSADGFAVADLNEAKALRDAGFNQSICLFAGCYCKIDFEQGLQLDVEPVIHCSEQLDLLEQLSHSPKGLWLKIDSGMHRLGFSPEQVEGAINRLKNLAPGPTISLMSHLANADQSQNKTNQSQQLIFETATNDYDYPRSLLNSAGLIGQQLAAYDWVRPGIALYGSSPITNQSAKDLGLKPVMTLKTKIISIKDVAQGDRVGYGGSWTAPQTTRIATIACGYGDGYPRHAGNQTPVLVNGQRVPLVGRVSMDLMTLDVSQLTNVTIGDEAILWGQGLAIDEIAEAVDTISYQLMCNISARVPRLIAGS